MALQEIFKKSAGRRCDGSYYIALSSAISDKKVQTCITLSKSVMQDMRWLVGDHVSIFFDLDDNTLHLKRTISGGYTLTCRAYMKNKKRSEFIGKSLASGVRFSDSRIIPVKFTPLSKEDCIIDADGIAFIYPEEFRRT